ncbi:MFS transporter [Nocardia sp. NEAU-G5]|uniref:MFS transporter n=1 Tax=Nocardia albiluteola TaxID=2842303 RepID=A0ABS6B5L6_9NOCA|nr:MFS transporter [Nocardia albiluteola]MBU3065026.1 MFS transporter [Nocardia albiluteola]
MSVNAKAAVRSAECDPEPPARYSSGRAWLITAALALFMVVNWGDKAALGLTAHALEKDLGLTSAQYGLAASSFFFLFGIGTVLGGILVNHIQTRWVLLTMAVLWAVVQFPMLGAASFSVLVASRVALGLAEGPALPVALHAVLKWFPDEMRDIPSSIVIGASAVGLVVAAPVISFIQVAWGWRWCFGAMGIAGLLWTVLWLCIGREGQVDEPIGPPEGPVQTSTTSSEDHEVTEPPVPYRRVFFARTWLCFALAGFACYFVTSLSTTWLPEYLESIRGLSTITTGNLIAGVAGFGALAMFGQGMISRRLIARGASTRWSRAGVAGVAVAVSGACLVGFTFLEGPLQLVLMLPAFSLYAASYAASSAAVAQISPAAQRGAVLGVLFGFLGAGGVVAPFVTGQLVQAAHGSAKGYNAVFLIGAALLAVSGLCVLLFADPERDARHLAPSVPFRSSRKSLTVTREKGHSQ